MNQLTDSQRETVADLLREAASRDHTQDLPLFGPVPAPRSLSEVSDRADPRFRPERSAGRRSDR